MAGILRDPGDGWVNVLKTLPSWISSCRQKGDKKDRKAEDRAVEHIENLTEQ